MLSILGWIGHLLRHSGFSVDQLDVIYTEPDRSFITPSRLLMLTLDDEKNGQKYVSILNHPLLIIPIKMHDIPHSRYRGSVKLV